jgi:transposase
MIRSHLDGIFAWTKLWISNGVLEGMNNKIKVVSDRASGYRTTGTYLTAAWHGCGDLPLE